MSSRNDFVTSFSRALEQQSAGLFVGAGLSMAAGYPSWSQLLKEIAEELKLDLAQEHDLAGVAQYHLNKTNHTRTQLAQIVRDSFPDDVEIPDVVRVLARLPVNRIWTTNYDCLIERAFDEQHKKLEVKSSNSDLATSLRDSSAVLMKMHGSVTHAKRVVIAKDDYESYSRTRSGFLSALSGDFVSRTLLFLGFSFTDPNLYHLMSMIRASFGDTPPAHFTVVRRPKRAGYRGKGATAKFEYDRNRFELWVDDLQRYGIRAVVVDEYEEIRQLLVEVEQRVAQRSVFVSGAYPDDAGDAEERRFLADVARKTGGLAAKLGFRLVSGFGLTVGNQAIMGMMEKLYEKPVANLEQRLLLRPFPGEMDDGQKRRYREDMLSNAGTCIVIGGMKGGKNAAGVIQEAKIALELGRVVIPVACTGWAAEVVWKQMGNKVPKVVTKADWNKLETARTVSDVMAVLERVLTKLKP